MERRRPPGTEEGYYALHDLRRIDWDAWREAPDTARELALAEGIEYLQSHEALEDAAAGGSAVFSVLGHKADLLVLHLRPALEYLDRAERRFETTALAGYTERASSYVSVTEVSGYMHEDLTDGLEDIEDEGMRNYMQQRIYPEIPDAEHVCFYPMDKRRGPEHNWYDLPFEERKEHMSAHGDIGREYAGKVTQIITGSVGLDDHEWGVTLFADDMTDIKHLLYEMRFDPSSSRYAEFGSFYIGRRFPPSDLAALFAGETLPTDGSLSGRSPDTAEADASTEATDDTGADAAEADDKGSPPATGPGHEEIKAATFARRAGVFDVDVAGTEAGYGFLFESDADVETLGEAVDELAGNFDHYETHARTEIRTNGDGAVAVVSLWANERSANTAAGFLADLPGVDTGVGADLTDAATSVEQRDETASDESTGESAADESTGKPDASGRPPSGEPLHQAVDPDTFQQRVHRFGIRLEEHPEAGYGLLFRSDIDAEDLVEEVDGLRGNFDHYDTHVLTTVRADAGDTAVISLWRNERAANTAAGFLSDLSGAGPGIGTRLDAGSQEDADTETSNSDGTDGSLHGTDGDGDIREELRDLDVYAGRPHGEDVYALVVYSQADSEELDAELSTLRERFDHYDAHVKSAVYAEEPRAGGRAAVVSIWDTREAADTASGFLTDLPGVVERYDESHAGEESGFGTMGMFYTVKPDHREDFLEAFDGAAEILEGMEGHLETRLLVNTEDENDMFIASQWRAKEDAMEFFRSEAFRDTVQFGREILDGRPRHVFLA